MYFRVATLTVAMVRALRVSIVRVHACVSQFSKASGVDGVADAAAERPWVWVPRGWLIG